MDEFSSPMVTWRSCMASRSALWTFAGARLISSARMRLLNIGPCFGAERAVLRAVNHGADDVGGQHVRRELQTLETHGNAIRQSLQSQGLGEAGDALQEHVTVGEQCDQQPVEKMPLADDDPAHLFPQRPYPS